METIRSVNYSDVGRHVFSVIIVSYRYDQEHGFTEKFDEESETFTTREEAQQWATEQLNAKPADTDDLAFASDLYELVWKEIDLVYDGMHVLDADTESLNWQQGWRHAGTVSWDEPMKEDK